MKYSVEAGERRFRNAEIPRTVVTMGASSKRSWSAVRRHKTFYEQLRGVLGPSFFKTVLY